MYPGGGKISGFGKWHSPLTKTATKLKADQYLTMLNNILRQFKFLLIIMSIANLMSLVFILDYTWYFSGICSYVVYDLIVDKNSFFKVF